MFTYIYREIQRPARVRYEKKNTSSGSNIDFYIYVMQYTITTIFLVGYRRYTNRRFVMSCSTKANALYIYMRVKKVQIHKFMFVML